MSAQGVNSELVRPLTSEEKEKRGWQLEVNGKIVTDVSHAKLSNEKMGVEWQYGMRAEGYDGVVIHEPGGGGSVLVPYVVYEPRRVHAKNDPIFDELLWIGLLYQERKTQGGSVLNLPAGFLDPGETHFQTAMREFKEETGRVAEANRVQDLCGGYARRGNANRAFFDTSRNTEDGYGEAYNTTLLSFTPMSLMS